MRITYNHEVQYSIMAFIGSALFVLFLFDFRAAFSSILQEFMLRSLRHIGVPPDPLALINSLSCIISGPYSCSEKAGSLAGKKKEKDNPVPNRFMIFVNGPP